MFYQRTEFRSPPSTRSIGSPISISPLPVFFAEGRGAHRPRSPRRPRSFSEERYGQTEQGRNSKFCRQMVSFMIYLSTKFHDHPIIPSIGSPVSIFPLPVPPDLFGRGPRGLSASSALAASAFSPVFFSWTARANGEREKTAILHPDPSGQQLALHQVSSRSVHAFYRRSLPYLFSPGLPDLFHRGPRSFYRPFRPKTIKRTLRDNQPQEMAQIWYTDTSGHVLPTYRVSSPASPGNPLNRRTDRRTDTVA